MEVRVTCFDFNNETIIQWTAIVRNVYEWYELVRYLIGLDADGCGYVLSCNGITYTHTPFDEFGTAGVYVEQVAVDETNNLYEELLNNIPEFLQQ